jgi:hypothetical protein
MTDLNGQEREALNEKIVAAWTVARDRIMRTDPMDMAGQGFEAGYKAALAAREEQPSKPSGAFLRAVLDVIEARGDREPRGALTYVANMAKDALAREEPVVRKLCDACNVQPGWVGEHRCCGDWKGDPPSIPCECQDALCRMQRREVTLAELEAEDARTKRDHCAAEREDTERPDGIVDGLLDDAIAAVPDLAVDAALLAVRSAFHDFHQSEENERRLMRVGIAAAMRAVHDTERPDELAGRPVALVLLRRAYDEIGTDEEGDPWPLARAIAEYLTQEEER